MRNIEWPKPKFEVGQVVKFPGESEAFRIEECYIEVVLSMHDEDEVFICYMAAGINSGNVVEFDDEVNNITKEGDDSEQVEELSEEEVTDKSELFEQYMKYIELDRFINSSGVADDHYKKKAEEILEKLKS